MLEVEVPPQGEIMLRRAVVAVDCGMTVNPDTVRAQIEGGLILGLGTAMYNEITLTGGARGAEQLPRLPHAAHERGAEDRGLPDPQHREARRHRRDRHRAAAPALGNAIFAATGKRLRRLPFGNRLQAREGGMSGGMRRIFAAAMRC